MPLLEIVGVTSTDMTFCVGCAFLDAEKEDNYSWACETLRLLMDKNSLTLVIVTDRELALMNAIERSFPSATHLLCRWHINKNVLAKCKKILCTKDRWDEFYNAWNLLIQSRIEATMRDRIERMCKDLGKLRML